MATTTYQTKVSYHPDTPDTLARVVTHLGHLIEGAREGQEIEARYFASDPGSQAPSWLAAACNARVRWPN